MPPPFRPRLICLYYLTLDGKMTAVDIHEGEKIDSGILSTVPNMTRLGFPINANDLTSTEEAWS
jgi:hypothetical protein